MTSPRYGSRANSIKLESVHRLSAGKTDQTDDFVDVAHHALGYGRRVAQLRAQPAIWAARAELTRGCSNNALGLHRCMFRIGD